MGVVLFGVGIYRSGEHALGNISVCGCSVVTFGTRTPDKKYSTSYNSNSIELYLIANASVVRSASLEADQRQVDEFLRSIMEDPDIIIL